MELHQLRYFVAVAELGKFTRAAKRCSISQPSLSQQIQKLERELGQPLFDRLGHRAELTSAGVALLERARRILLEVEQAARVVREQDGSGKVRLGVLPSIAPYLLPGLLKHTRARLPQATIEVDEDFRGPLVEAVLAGTLDVLIGTLPPVRPDLDVEELFSEPLLVAVAADDPLATKSVVTPADLSGRKLVLLGEASSLGLLARRFFGDHHIPVEIACRCAQVKTMKSLVAAGLGIAIVPSMAVSLEHPGVTYRAVSGTQPRREILLIRHRDRHRGRIQQVFVDCLREFCAARSSV